MSETVDRHAVSCSWHKDWTECNCGLFDRLGTDYELCLHQALLAQKVAREIMRDCPSGVQLRIHNAFAQEIRTLTSLQDKNQTDSQQDQ